jgi:hypothetical protein
MQLYAKFPHVNSVIFGDGMRAHGEAKHRNVLRPSPSVYLQGYHCLRRVFTRNRTNACSLPVSSVPSSASHSLQRQTSHQRAAGSSIDAVAPCSESRQQPCTTLQGVLRRLPRSARAINLISRSLKSFFSHFPFLNLPSPKVLSPATNPQRVANISRQLFSPRTVSEAAGSPRILYTSLLVLTL